MFQSRIMNYNPVNKTISYWYERLDDGGVRVDVYETAVDFMKKLIPHIPDENLK